jgi:hypothetical protein
MHIHANHAATATFSDKGVQGSARAFSRKAKAMRESLAEEAPPYLSRDLELPMDQILREEERRE